MSRSPGPLVLKSLIIWQCLGIGPSNLEGIWSSPVDDSKDKGHGQGHHDFSTKKLIIWQCLRLEHLNLDGMLVLTRR